MSEFAVAEILMGLITIGIAVIAELLRRMLVKIGEFSRQLTVLSTTIALCPNCPHTDHTYEKIVRR